MRAQAASLSQQEPVSIREFLQELFQETQVLEREHAEAGRKLAALRDHVRLRLFALEMAQDEDDHDLIVRVQSQMASGAGFPDALPAEDFVQSVRDALT